MRRKKVFICDDDQGIVDMLGVALSELCGAEIRTQTQSVHAIQQMHDDKPDILVVDLSMPLLTGDELISKLRSDSVLSDLFIICISANLNGREQSMAAGADVFIAKPFDLDDIIALIA